MKPLRLRSSLLRVLVGLLLAGCGARSGASSKSREPEEPPRASAFGFPYQRQCLQDGWLAVPESIGQGGRRISGDVNVQLPDDIKKVMAIHGLSQLTVVVEHCRAEDGKTSRVAVVAPALPADFDAYLRQRVGEWVYSPFVVGGKAVPACSLIVFNYRLQ